MLEDKYSRFHEKACFWTKLRINSVINQLYTCFYMNQHLRYINLDLIQLISFRHKQKSFDFIFAKMFQKTDQKLQFYKCKLITK